MPVTVRKLSNTSVAISGIDTKLAGKAAWRKVFDRIGRRLQQRVAESFEKQVVAGSRRLRPNSPEWNAYKRKHGLDPRRGHATGRLQRALHSQQRLYSVGAITPQGTCIIRMREDWLRSRVPYAEYYEQAKVQGGHILAIAKRWVELEGVIAVEFGKEVAARAVRGVGLGKLTADQIRKRAEQIAAPLVQRMEFQRLAPLNPIHRPKRIQKRLAVTQAQMMKISKQAKKMAKAAGRLDEFERMIELMADRAARRLGI